MTGVWRRDRIAGIRAGGAQLNLWAAGRCLDPDTRGRLIEAVIAMVRVYPQLAPSTLWTRTLGDSTLVSLTNAPSALGHRRYVWADHENAALYEGTLLHPVATGHDAESLHRQWAALTEAEGQFSAARATARSLEVIVDPLGMEPVYVHERGRTCLLSTSVAVLAAVTGCRTLDPLGAATFLAWGWAGRDRTLNEGIRVLPGGRSLWSDDGYSRRPSSLRHDRRRVDIGSLADELVALVQRLPGDEIEAGLTAGKDSRLIAALLLRAGIKASFFTGGHPTSPDVQAATALAARVGLRHRTLGPATESWEVTRDRLLAQCDGMVSLWQVTDVADQPTAVNRLPMRLWGVGGEIARGYWTHPKLLLRPQQASAHLLQSFGHDHGGLLTTEAVGAVRGELDAFAAEHPGRPLDLLDHFYMEERVRRWGGANGRKSRPTLDRFTPYVTRPFIEAAFARPSRRRLAESLHYDLLKHLHPGLHAVPLAKPWRPQNGLVNLGMMLGNLALARVRRPKAKASPPQGGVLDQRAEEFMAYALDRSSSPVWALLSRPTFERVMRNAAARKRHQRLVWDALTLLG
jgi:hypothetical protein